ncbi:MAG: adenylate/guanylate cyclase domain-containing protein, partial [Spirochaetales bacterium]|nr:adenylate/guanylate cyclase domain-containing protein [Spirochaetales bacterium]
MGIRSKIFMIVLPLIITPLVFTAIVSGLSARNGITTVATQFLQFKSEQLLSYANNQWQLLESNNLQDNQSFLEAAKSAVTSFSVNMTRSDTELIFAVTPDGTIEMQTRAFDLGEGERGRIAQLIAEDMGGWQELAVGGAARVANVVIFPPFRWTIFVTEEKRTFYKAVNDIVYRVVIILGISLAAALFMLIIFTGILTRPLRNVVAAMTDIITTNDLSKRVEVLYRDETGKLGHTFNLMVGELQNAYNNIKSYALRAVVAQAKEQKIRNIFQKYVPKDVIDQFFANPERMLIGEDRILAVLFSDIRSFTTISERMRPDELVESLNQYFTIMVDTIMGKNGIVDKYIGDAIMAFFGAPVRREDDAQQSVYAGLEMLETLSDFNRWQVQKGRPEFRIGIGINYGTVTVGNIGSEKKMDYTV